IWRAAPSREPCSRMPSKSRRPPAPTTNRPLCSSHSFVFTATAGSSTVACAPDGASAVFARRVGSTLGIIGTVGKRPSDVGGDDRGATSDAKMQAYARGRQVADLALERDPRSADARFWRAANLGRWLERNRLQAATRIGSLRDEVQAIVRDHPDYVGAYSFLGNYYYRAPWPWGNLDEATRMFRQGLARDPRATGMRVGLARALIDNSLPNEA